MLGWMGAGMVRPSQAWEAQGLCPRTHILGTPWPRSEPGLSLTEADSTVRNPVFPQLLVHPKLFMRGLGYAVSLLGEQQRSLPFPFWRPDV